MQRTSNLAVVLYALVALAGVAVSTIIRVGGGQRFPKTGSQRSVRNDASLVQCTTAT